MNPHKNARLTFARRPEMVQDMTERGLNAAQAAARRSRRDSVHRTQMAWGATWPRACRGWSMPHRARSVLQKAISPGTALLIVELRRKCWLQARIAQQVGVSTATVSRVLTRAGLSRLPDLQPRESVQRYEHEAMGDLLHIDIKKLGRIERSSHRVTGHRRDSTKGIGWEFLFVAVDDPARIVFTGMHPNERQESAVQFLHDAVAHYASLGVRIKRVLTDNGSAFRFKLFRAVCTRHGIVQKFTRTYRLQANGKAERFIQSAPREWAYGWICQSSAQRTQALLSWQHHYNWHRPHHGIGRLPPMSRFPTLRNNLLILHS